MSVTRTILKDGTVEYRDENGELHREGRPALITYNISEWYTHGVKYMDKNYEGTVRYFNALGQLHSDVGPAVRTAGGGKEWWQNGKRHRLDGPAIEWGNGDKEWYQHGELHREDGPAVEYVDGKKRWYQHDHLHREDGPAVIYPNGDEEYWINDENYTKQEFNKKTQNLTESVTKNTYMTKQGRVIEYRDENGELHHDMRAALINPKGFHFYNHGVKYKKIDPKGNIYWYNKDGEFHRDDGPAIELANGTKEWHQHGELHREDGPALEYISGYKAWYQNGEPHRVDGPAVIYTDGDEEYWIKGQHYTKQEFNKKTKNLTESVTKNTYMTKQGRVIEYRDENGELHHDTRAALIDPEGFHFYNHGVKYKKIDPKGNVFWYNKDGEFHREDGPAFELANGTKEWYRNGQFHRIDGPAVEYPDGYKSWWQNDRLHREDGPAREWKDGSKEWYQHNKLHRLDGPAVIYPNGGEEWWINGKNYSEKQFKEKTKNLNESVTKNTYMTKQGRVIEYRDENGELHHDTRAALIDPEGFHFYNHGVLYKRVDPNGDIFWYNKDGQLHRDDGPAVETPAGDKEWFQNGKRHRLDGPAVDWSIGYGEWYQHDKLHRENGPAIEYPNGTKEWYQYGKLHRLDGPAREYANGRKEYWINGRPIPKEEFIKRYKGATHEI